MLNEEDYIEAFNPEPFRDFDLPIEVRVEPHSRNQLHRVHYDLTVSASVLLPDHAMKINRKATVQDARESMLRELRAKLLLRLKSIDEYLEGATDA